MFVQPVYVFLDVLDVSRYRLILMEYSWGEGKLLDEIEPPFLSSCNLKVPVPRPPQRCRLLVPVVKSGTHGGFPTDIYSYFCISVSISALLG